MGNASGKLKKLEGKYVFKFEDLALAELKCGNDWDKVRGLLGGKGANLARMADLKLPVPPGFTLTTECCVYYMDKSELPNGVWDDVVAAVEHIETVTNKKFGDPANPLLFSCRSGSKFSMPGMMDTVLNIGLNDETAQGLIKLTNDRFVYDSYRRLIQGFGSVVMGIDDEKFEHPLKEYKQRKGYAGDIDMTADDWKALIEEYKVVFKNETKEDFIQDPVEQLRRAALAVFQSWNSKRAFAYRNAAKISHRLGTACNIQTMVFGNMGDQSATGVCFSRNPSTGEKVLYGDYLANAQGEDVVAGIRNTSRVADMGRDFAKAHAKLVECNDKLEAYFKNMQDIEFTIENEELYMLQCRDGKRTAAAAVRIACEMVKEGLITKEEAVRRVSPTDVNRLLHPQLDPESLKKAKQLAQGINASPGGAVGKVVFDANTAEKRGKEGEAVILVRPFTKPDDVHGFFASRGILTAEGGATSHAAVVARQFGIPCVCGAADINIDVNARTFTVGGTTVKENDFISLDGATGIVYLGQIKTSTPSFEDQTDLRSVLDWADEICEQEGTRTVGPKYFPHKGMQVWANADSGPDAARAREFGAKGIGLCRTEHMFFDQSRLPTVQAMILAKTPEDRVKELDKLLPMQRSDFEDIFRAMDSLPVTIRTIDPPLHEFLPHLDDLIADVATLQAGGEIKRKKRSEKKELKEELKEAEALLVAVKDMHEENPMMALRGVRLSIIMPEIVHMQMRAIFEAACNVQKEGKKVQVNIMIPLTSHANELRYVLPKQKEVMEKVFEEKGCRVPHKFGTMIETPRATLVAGPLAEDAEFFSFGTNDLTQMTYGYSRDDAERKFLLQYVDQKILPDNPFQTLDDEGVGRLVRMATNEGRAVRNDISVGLCGEHGGDPETVKLCHAYGLNYVSCSAFRVPLVRMAAAHAVLSHADQEYYVTHMLPPPK